MSMRRPSRRRSRTVSSRPPPPSPSPPKRTSSGSAVIHGGAAAHPPGTESVAEELEPGDFAVHRIHGVGRYTGITHRALAGAERDYLILEYAQSDKLFVPSDQVGMVARYLGGDAPRLHRLGGTDWVAPRPR